MIHPTKVIHSILFILSAIAVSPCWSIEVGELLPDFSVEAFDGNTYSRASLAGRPVLLVFWNSWCDVCLQELPKVRRLNDKFGPRGLAVLAVNTAINDSESKARAYWKMHGHTFPTGFDHYFELGTAFGVMGVPTIFLADPQGMVRYKHARIPENIEERLEQLTAQ